MSGYRETVLSGYLEDFIENRECYNCDCSDAIHEYCDATACGMKHQDMMNIIDCCGGVFKCIKNYIDEYGEFDFDRPEYDCNATLVYYCMANYINENYEDAISQDDTDEDILVINNLNIG
jgi:hypothetical protein